MWTSLIGGVAFLAFAYFLVPWLWRRRTRTSSDKRPSAQLYALAAALAQPFEAAARPLDLVGHEDFERGVALLGGSRYSNRDLLGYYTGDNVVIAIMALEALARRRDGSDLRDEIIANLHGVNGWVKCFALRALRTHAPASEPLLGALLVKADPSWLYRPLAQFLYDFVRERLSAGEPASFGGCLKGISEAQAEPLERLLRMLGEDVTTPFLTELRELRPRLLDVVLLRSIGKIWPSPDGPEEESVIEHEALLAQVAALESLLAASPPQSVLLVGEPGVGKTATVRALGAKLQQQGWVIFEAGVTELLAGQKHIGELEERLRTLARGIACKPRLLWFVPEFHALQLAGRHQYSQTSVLDFLMPYVESGEIILLGETRPAAFERLTQEKPSLLTTFVTRRIAPLAGQATVELASRWAHEQSLPGEPEMISRETLEEAWQLAQQYLGEQAAPGNLLHFLAMTRSRLAAGGAGRACHLKVDDLIVTLTQLTGLPESILDERHSLDIAALRRLFERRVLGQSEAVDVLLDRVAMIKAGVTDPTRPLGVFLFAGPTGTGKTEIAKVLCEFLFGAPERMIRFDMSELQTPESLGRLMGEVGDQGGGSLVERIRKQPFSVILLDEFEKAHPRVWDLFLQVFDDGRLTDRRGSTADFRHAIIIMTSNLGGVIPSGASLGFTSEGDRFRPETVERAIAGAFRREFLNRIDRVVIFRPLGKETMRAILLKELVEITHRRGLRSRAWAVEWGEDALEFLLAKGFTADLGARPLKRAVERYVLAPLAMTIVNHQYPKGDQFLFVRADGGKLAVEFVDPDAPAAGAPVATPALPHEADDREPPLRLETIAFEPRGAAPEMASLETHYARIRATVECESWQQDKQAALTMTASPDFWRSPDRFAILGEAEYLDRIERGVEAAGSLLQRLRGSHPGGREHQPRDLVARLAQQLFLLDAACAGVRAREPREVFLLVEASRDLGVLGRADDEFAARLGSMYRTWAEKRRMQLQTLEESCGDGRNPYRLLLAVSGYAAFSILRSEDGLHVFEVPEGEAGFLRCKARVRVVPQPDAPAGDDPQALRRQAAEALRAAPAPKPAVVRRYREAPSPLVRDGVRGWRTGKLDRVLGGDFDLMAGLGSMS